MALKLSSKNIVAMQKIAFPHPKFFTPNNQYSYIQVNYLLCDVMTSGGGTGGLGGL